MVGVDDGDDRPGRRIVSTPGHGIMCATEEHDMSGVLKIDDTNFATEAGSGLPMLLAFGRPG